MKEIFDSKLKAKLSIDENEDVRNITHSDEHWKSNKQSPLDVAVEYLQNVTKTFKLPTKSLENLSQKTSFDEPQEQNVQYQLSEQKDFFDSTTVSFYQTYLNLPVWRAGISVIVERTPATHITPTAKDKGSGASYNVVQAVNTSQRGIDAKLPPSETIQRYKELFHTNKGLKRRDGRKLSKRGKNLILVIS